MSHSRLASMHTGLCQVISLHIPHTPAYHLNSFSTPSSISTLCVQPSEWSFVTSMSFRGVPSGFAESNTTSPSKPTVFTISLDNSLIVSSYPVPTLMWQLRISPREGMAPPRPSLLFRSTTPEADTP